jgi:hypothetical protein
MHIPIRDHPSVHLQVYDHLVVVTSLAHADTLASSSLRYDLIPSFRPRQGPSGLLDSAQYLAISSSTASRICLFTLPYIMPSCAYDYPTSRNERLITVFSFLRPPSNSTSLLPPPAPPHPRLSRHRAPLRDFHPSRIGRPWSLWTLYVLHEHFDLVWQPQLFGNT